MASTQPDPQTSEKPALTSVPTDSAAAAAASPDESSDASPTASPNASPNDEAVEETAPSAEAEAGGDERSSGWVPWLVAGILFMLLLLAGGFGVTERQQREAVEAELATTTQNLEATQGQLEGARRSLQVFEMKMALIGDGLGDVLGQISELRDLALPPGAAASSAPSPTPAAPSAATPPAAAPQGQEAVAPPAAKSQPSKTPAVAATSELEEDVTPGFSDLLPEEDPLDLRLGEGANLL